jgi:hypothetical protein
LEARLPTRERTREQLGALDMLWNSLGELEVPRGRHIKEEKILELDESSYMVQKISGLEDKREREIR